jgi:hypothetical protein
MPWTWVLGWGCLAGRSFLDGRRKIIKSQQQQRSSNEKEFRTAARMRNKFASLQMAGLFGACPEQRTVSEYNNSRSQSQEQGWSDGLTVGLAVADHFGCRRSVLQDDKKKRVNEIGTWLNSSAQATSSGFFC